MADVRFLLLRRFSGTVLTFTNFADLRDKSPQVNHNKDINLACFKLNGVLDCFESVLIPIVFSFEHKLN